MSNLQPTQGQGAIKIRSPKDYRKVTNSIDLKLRLNETDNEKYKLVLFLDKSKLGSFVPSELINLDGLPAGDHKITVAAVAGKKILGSDRIHLRVAEINAKSRKRTKKEKSSESSKSSSDDDKSSNDSLFRLYSDSSSEEGPSAEGCNIHGEKCNCKPRHGKNH